MIDTNSLLNIGLALIANFTNVVHVREDAVPTTPDQIAHKVLGSRAHPTEMYLVDKMGTEFWIRNGVVYSYCSPGSYFELQNPALAPKFEGESRLTTNQAADLAAATLRRLVKQGDPLTNCIPEVVCAGIYHGKHMPFFFVLFSKVYGTGDIATVEIDGRTATIVALHLWDTAFDDMAAAREIERKVYTPEKVAVKPRPGPPRELHVDPRLTNEILATLPNYSAFCAQLGVSPESNCNLTNVDWEQTIYYFELRTSRDAMACEVAFKDGASYTVFNGTVFGYVSSNSCFTGAWFERPHDEWARFHGRIVKRWQDLAGEVENRLIRKFGISRSALDALKAAPPGEAPKIGSSDLKRLMVWWEPKKPNLDVALQGIMNSDAAINAEFDLETGELECLLIYDAKMIKQIGKSQIKPK